VNFLIDHDVPERIGDVLRQEGHSVIRLREVLPVEAKDAEVLKYAAEHELILVTCNRDDFLKLAAAIAHRGLIVLIRRRSRLLECSAILKLIRKAGEAGLINNVNFA
jgi:predicted nuclease of predicted toxin-antitoxin system